MRRHLFLAIVSASMPSFGQAPPAPNVPAAAPAELRTLFHSAAEREKLDRARRGEPAQESAAVGEKRSPPKITGFVRRSDGRDTVWLDGRAVTGAEAKRLPETAKAPEPAPGNRPIEIKPSR